MQWSECKQCTRGLQRILDKGLRWQWHKQMYTSCKMHISTFFAVLWPVICVTVLWPVVCVCPSFIVVSSTIGTLRNKTAGRLRMTEWRKNVARDCAFPVLSDISSFFCRLSLPAVLLRQVPVVDNTMIMKLGQTQIFVWKFLVPRETVLLRQRRSDKRIFAIKPKLPLYDHNKAEISNVSPS